MVLLMRPPPPPSTPIRSFQFVLLINNNETALPRYYASEWEREKVSVSVREREGEKEIRLQQGVFIAAHTKAKSKVAAR